MYRSNRQQVLVLLPVFAACLAACRLAVCHRLAACQKKDATGMNEKENEKKRGHVPVETRRGKNSTRIHVRNGVIGTKHLKRDVRNGVTIL